MAKAEWDEYGLYHVDGKAWGTKLIEIEPKDGKRRWLAIPVCYGKDDDIKPKGSEQKQDERLSKSTFRAISLQRGRIVRSPRRIKRGAR